MVENKPFMEPFPQLVRTTLLAVLWVVLRREVQRTDFVAIAS